jgi:hypothetical protein
MHLTNESLFRIIKSLSPEDERGLEKQLKKKGAKTQIFILYKTIAPLSEYNEASVREILKRKIPKQSFAVVKNALTEQILLYLRSQQKNMNAHLREWLDFAYVLLTKNLFEEAAIYCDKVKKEAWRYGQLYFIIEANYRKTSILQYVQKDNFQNVIDELIKESIGIIELVGLTFKAARYYYNIASLVHDEDNVRSKTFMEAINILRKNELFDIDASDKKYPFYMSSYLAMAKNCIYRYSGEFENAYQQEKIIWDRLREDWEFFCANIPKEVASSVVNYTMALSATEHKDELQKHFEFVGGLIQTTFKDNEYLASFLQMVHLQQLLLHKEGIKYSDLLCYIDFHESKHLDPYLDLKKNYEFYLARAFFYTGHYKQAEEYLGLLLNNYKSTLIRSGMREYALFMDLINGFTIYLNVSFETMKLNIESTTKVYNEHIRRIKDYDYSFERMFIKFFNSIKNDSSRKDVLLAIEKLQAELAELNPCNSVYLYTMFENFDVEFILQKWTILIMRRTAS